MKRKTFSRLPATPVMARMMLTRAPMPTERNGLTFGMTVLKLFAAMNDEKQAPGKEATVKPIMIAVKSQSWWSSSRLRSW